MSATTYNEAVVGNIRAEMGRQFRRTAEVAGVMGVSPDTARRVLSGGGRALRLNELEYIASWLVVSPKSLAGTEAVKAAA